MVMFPIVAGKTLEKWSGCRDSWLAPRGIQLEYLLKGAWLATHSAGAQTFAAGPFPFTLLSKWDNKNVEGSPNIACYMHMYLKISHFQYPVTWYKDNTASTEMTTHQSNIFNNRNLHCDIQQLPRSNPTHQAKEYQRLALSILNRKSHCIIKIKHTRHIILSLSVL